MVTFHFGRDAVLDVARIYFLIDIHPIVSYSYIRHSLRFSHSYPCFISIRHLRPISLTDRFPAFRCYRHLFCTRRCMNRLLFL